MRAWITRLREQIAVETASTALPAPSPRRRGRPTKAEQIARRQGEAAAATARQEAAA